MEAVVDDLVSRHHVLAFREGVRLVEHPEGVAVRSAAGRSVPVSPASPGLAAALRALASGCASEADIAAAGEARDGAAAPVIHYYLERLKHLGLLLYTARYNSIRLATLVPGRSPARPVAPDPGARHVLSRFAYLRREAGQMVLESPLTEAKVVLHDPRAAGFCQALSEPRTMGELAALLPDAARSLLALLLGSQAAEVEGHGREPGGRALAFWSFHDLLFHARSRQGRSPGPVGATFPFAGEIEPLPAVKPHMAEVLIELHRPDIEALRSGDMTLTSALEDRSSVRLHGERPIHVRQLGELLYRAARVRSFGVSSGVHAYPTTRRPHPGGGACHELELYLAVRACEGLAPGLYHYEPADHGLSALSGSTPAVDALLSSARAALQTASQPQVLLVVAARFGRVMWKYEAMAYATILKDVGALYQTIYLVATAMGLAPCAVGSGNADLFAAAAGLDYHAETSVGELALGSRPER
jgi:SagB-type dehydrogenase family enzyme